jgi:vacuolar protein sorting-associated protein 54
VAHLCPKAYSSLSTELQQHSTEFLRVTHDEAKSKLGAIVEVEQWKQVDIPSDYQDIVSSLVRKQVPKIQEAELLKLREAEPTADKANVAKELIVDGAAYKAVSSGLLLLSMVTHYMQCLAHLQTVATHVAQKLPALLKLFHTTAYQQVLRAGAMRPDSAGLKSISAKHLALSSQSLGMFLALMPHIKAVLAAYVPEAQRTLLKEMDSAVRRLRAQTLDEQTHRPSSLLLTPLG